MSSATSKPTDADVVIAVVDASAVAVVILDPSESAAQLALRLRPYDLYAPDHLPVELTSVIRRHRNQAKLSDAEARIALDSFWDLPVELWPFRPLADRVWELRQNLSTYDAAYVALAEQLDGLLVTADQRLSRATGIHCRVEVVGA